MSAYLIFSDWSRMGARDLSDLQGQSVDALGDANRCVHTPFLFED